MKKPTGNIVGKRSQDIKKGMHKLTQMLRANPGMELHRGGFVPVETQSEGEICSNRRTNNGQENRVDTPRRSDGEIAVRGRPRRRIERPSNLTGNIDRMIESAREERENAREESEN